MTKKIDPHIGASIIIFGANGDLCNRKLIPALFNLFITDHLAFNFKIVCIDHSEISPQDYISNLLRNLTAFSRSGKPDVSAWNTFSSHILYVRGDFTDSALYIQLAEMLNGFDIQVNSRNRRLFYFSVAPRFIETISEGLHKSKVSKNKSLDRLIIEKPFGSDLATAKKLNKFLLGRYHESQIYRIDHYLGKETVQNIMVFRFANSIFEPLWNHRFIDSIEISVLESVSVGARAGYYDQAGALKDMIQNHLLQLLCIIAMECPKTTRAEEIRNKKLGVLKSILPFNSKTIEQNTIRSQYSEGIVNNQRQIGYIAEEKVNPESTTEHILQENFISIIQDGKMFLFICVPVKPWPGHQVLLW